MLATIFVPWDGGVLQINSAKVPWMAIFSLGLLSSNIRLMDVVYTRMMNIKKLRPRVDAVFPRLILDAASRTRLNVTITLKPIK